MTLRVRVHLGKDSVVCGETWGNDGQHQQRLLLEHFSNKDICILLLPVDLPPPLGRRLRLGDEAVIVFHFSEEQAVTFPCNLLQPGRVPSSPLQQHCVEAAARQLASSLAFTCFRGGCTKISNCDTNILPVLKDHFHLSFLVLPSQHTVYGSYCSR